MIPFRASTVLVALLGVGCVPGSCPNGRICSVMGTGELGFNGDGLPPEETRLASPTDVAVHPDGRPVAVDYSNMRLRIVGADGTVETLVGNGEHAYSEIGAGVLDTPLENPVAADWGPHDVLYLLPQHEGRLVMVDHDEVVELCAGTGIIGDYGDGGDALDARLGFGGGLAVGEDGTLFISDQSFHKVRRVRPSGTIDTVLGVGGAGAGEPGRPGPEVAIDSPERLALDPERNRLLVADTGNNRVLALDLDDLTVTWIAGNGERGYSGDGGPAIEASLFEPVGVEVTPDGHVLISDLRNRVLRAVAPDGTIETVAGGGDPDGHWPARPEEAPLAGPAGLTWSPEGDLLIADRSGHRILRWRGIEEAL